MLMSVQNLTPIGRVSNEGIVLQALDMHTDQCLA
jgi:hypothetical protein